MTCREGFGSGVSIVARVVLVGLDTEEVVFGFIIGLVRIEMQNCLKLSNARVDVVDVGVMADRVKGSRL